LHKIELPESKELSLNVYRNIATCSPSQELFDDLVDLQEEFDILFDAEASASNVDRNIPGKFRCQQYGNIDDSLLCFDERFWAWGRFGDGSFGVWYSAIEEETSIHDTLYHRPELDKNDMINADGPIIQDRRMFSANLSLHSSVDLRTEIDRYPDIVHPDDYTFCQSLGAQAVLTGIASFQTCSARYDGTCVPVFEPSIITDKILYDYHNFFPLNGQPPYATRKIL